MLRRSDLVSGSRQNKNAGNSGDLLKHSAYLALLHELASHGVTSEELNIVEAHSGKGVYAALSPHLRKARALPEYEASPLGSAQARAFLAPPSGLGPIAGLLSGEMPYAGSAVLHAFELSRLRRRSLVLMDHDAQVRGTLARVFGEAALAPVAPELQILDPGEFSEPHVLLALERGKYTPAHVLHFDPFAFVMDPDDSLRSPYKHLIANSDELVARGQLAAATLFFTWGSNSRAALDDLDCEGYRGGLEGGFRDLIETVDPTRRIVLTWCWEFFFSLLLVVPSDLRAKLVTRLASYVAPFRPRLSRLTIQ